MKKKEDSLNVALDYVAKHGKQGEKDKRRREGVGIDQGRAGRHLINTAQCSCSGQMYSTGSWTY